MEQVTEKRPTLETQDTLKGKAEEQNQLINVCSTLGTGLGQTMLPGKKRKITENVADTSRNTDDGVVMLSSDDERLYKKRKKLSPLQNLKKLDAHHSKLKAFQKRTDMISLAVFEEVENRVAAQLKLEESDPKTFQVRACSQFFAELFGDAGLDGLLSWGTRYAAITKPSRHARPVESAQTFDIEPDLSSRAGQLVQPVSSDTPLDDARMRLVLAHRSNDPTAVAAWALLDSYTSEMEHLIDSELTVAHDDLLRYPKRCISLARLQSLWSTLIAAVTSSEDNPLRNAFLALDLWPTRPGDKWAEIVYRFLTAKIYNLPLDSVRRAAKYGKKDSMKSQEPNLLVAWEARCKIKRDIINSPIFEKLEKTLGRGIFLLIGSTYPTVR